MTSAGRLTRASTCAIVNVLPEPVTPSSTCALSPRRSPSTSWPMACGWSPRSSKSVTRLKRSDMRANNPLWGGNGVTCTRPDPQLAAGRIDQPHPHLTELPGLRLGRQLVAERVACRHQVADPRRDARHVAPRRREERLPAGPLRERRHDVAVARAQVAERLVLEIDDGVHQDVRDLEQAEQIVDVE